MWAGQQPVDGAIIGSSGAPDEAIVATIEALDVELLARLDAVELPDLGRQNDLPFEDTVVFIDVRYRLTRTKSKRLEGKAGKSAVR
ncbi:MAG: hypothetical protein Q7R30_00730 [Acidobacteriota bacterium]|nr:hypothetical protein [Acidobacteriota bacterium]